MTRSTVITDASFCKVKDKTYAGWAAWVRVDGVVDPIQRYGVLGRVPIRNSTDAELYAAVNGLWLAKRYGATGALLQSDCMGVVEAINGRVRPTSPMLYKLHKALEHADVKGLDLYAKHVKAHTKNTDVRSHVNAWCDDRAKAAMRAQRDGKK